MSNRWCDGLGRYGGTKAHMLNGSSSQAWAQVDSDLSLSSANPRTGSWHLRLGGGDVGVRVARRVFGAALTEVYLGVAIYCHTLPATEGGHANGLKGSSNGIALFDICDAANDAQFTIWIGTDGALVAKLGATLIERSDPCIGAGAYQHIEMYAKAGNGDGAIEIRVDEVTRLNLTGIDTVQTANVEFSQWLLGHGTNASATIDFADFFCNDTEADGSGCDTWVGDCKSGCNMVNADTAQADFTLSSGVTGYELLDETPANDSDYIETSSSTARSDFGFANVPASTSEILTVRPFVRAMKDDAGTCTIAPSILSGGDTAVVDDQPITTAFAYYDSNVPLDPDTGVPWLPAAVDAAVEVVERVS